MNSCYMNRLDTFAPDWYLIDADPSRYLEYVNMFSKIVNG